MNEGMSTGPSPEKNKPTEEEVNAELFADYLRRHPQPDSREANPEIQQFEILFAEFEAKYPLQELHAIIDITPEESRKHPLREPARVALIPILALINSLGRSPRLEELKAKYKILSRAVGMINNNKVDHNR